MNDQPYNDLIGDMLKKDNYAYEKDLKGKGKPLKASYLQGDVVQHFQRVAREQGYLPEWLKKQHEIRALLEQEEQNKTFKQPIKNKSLQSHVSTSDVKTDYCF